MVFSNLFFLFVFLPLNLLCYSLAKTIRTRNIIMLMFSLFFYAWGEPVYVFLLVGMALADWFFARLIQKGRDDGKMFLSKVGLIGALIVSLGLLGTFKYTGFLAETFHQLTGFPSVIPQIALPIGISFYTFQLISYVVDVYRGEVEAQKKFWLLLMYVSLFHQCIAGPIVRYQDVSREILCRKASREEISRGISRFCTGLAKKALLANSCGALADTLLLSDAVASNAASLSQNLATLQARPVLSLWLGVLAFMFQIYLDFSAYSDMAIGMGLMIGFHYKENFNYPYLSRSVSEFWRRWHISLGSFFRDYVYIPLGGNRRGLPRTIANLFIVWFLTGLWHGASWNFVLWGAYYAVLLMVEKLGLLRVLARLPRMLQHAYALFFIVVGWALFACTEPGQLSGVFGALFGLSGVPLYDASSLFLLKNNVLLWLLLVFASTASFARLHTHLLSRHWYAEVLCPLGLAAALLACTAFIVSGSFNPFLYFRF